MADESFELPQDQLLTKLAVELMAQEEVMAFEKEKALVNLDHVAMQASIWGEREPLATPADFNESGRKG